MAYLPDPGGFDLLVGMLKAQGKLGHGRTFWVNNGTAMYGANGAADGNDGLSWKTPMSTIQAAIDRCTTSNFDNVIVVGDHAENISSAGAIAMSKIGLTLYGLGRGSSIPTLTFASSTAATLTASAAGCTIDGIKFVCNIDELVSGIVVSAAGFTLKNCWWVGSATPQARVFMLTTSGASQLTLDNNLLTQATISSTTTTFLKVVGAIDNLKVVNNRMIGAVTADVGHIKFLTGGAAATNIYIADNLFDNRTAASTVCIDCNDNAVTGTICKNYFRVTTDGGVAPITAASSTLSYYDNLVVNNDKEYGILFGTASS